MATFIQIRRNEEDVLLNLDTVAYIRPAIEHEQENGCLIYFASDLENPVHFDAEYDEIGAFLKLPEFDQD